MAIPKIDLAAAAVGQIRDAILSGAIAAGDEEQARVIGRVMVLGTPR